MKTIRNKYFIAVIAILTFWSCSDLDVKNLNAPDFNTAFSKPADIEGVAKGLINNWIMTLKGFGGTYESPAFALWISADAGTCSWGNFGMRDFGKEPRLEFNNEPNYTYAKISEDYYNGLYSTLSQSNDILKQTVVNNINIGTNAPMVNAIAYLVQGLSLGYIGLLYDKGFVVTQETDMSGNSQTSSYSVIIQSAVNSLDKCIDISSKNTFTIPSDWLPGDSYTNTEIAELARTFAARLLVYSARNKTENNSTNWQKVYDYASNGIKKDFAPLADEKVWYNGYIDYSCSDGWGQVDMYVIHLMDNNIPAQFPSDGQFSSMPNDGKATSTDARLDLDFEYKSSCPFSPTRGYYFFSSYRYKRLDSYLTTYKEQLPEIRKAENDYFVAEAAVHLGKLSEAATVLNASARVTRGNLPSVSANADEILNAIHYERMVELMLSGFGVEYFEMRKSDLLQKGTILHFPIPGSQLEVMQKDYYTFGATTGIAGVDFSNGGWK